jgi:hypothetical protein
MREKIAKMINDIATKSVEYCPATPDEAYWADQILSLLIAEVQTVENPYLSSRMVDNRYINYWQKVAFENARQTIMQKIKGN